jgi:plasmid stabilization system protein ParE
MTPIKFHPDADSEMMAAAIYYESQQEDLGKRFLSIVQNSINHIQINPNIYPVVHIDVRRCLTETFPFSILFRITPEKIIIMAVMHQHQNPGYWKYR